MSRERINSIEMQSVKLYSLSGRDLYNVTPPITPDSPTNIISTSALSNIDRAARAALLRIADPGVQRKLRPSRNTSSVFTSRTGRASDLPRLPDCATDRGD